MHESDIAIKNEIAKAIVKNSNPDVNLLSIINTKINIDFDSMKPKIEKHFWFGNIKVSLKIRWFLL